MTKPASEEQIDEEVDGRIDDHQQLAERIEAQQSVGQQFVAEVTFDERHDLQNQFRCFADDEDDDYDDEDERGVAVAASVTTSARSATPYRRLVGGCGSGHVMVAAESARALDGAHEADVHEGEDGQRTDVQQVNVHGVQVYVEVEGVVEGRSVDHTCRHGRGTDVDPLHDAAVEEARDIVEGPGDERTHDEGPSSVAREQASMARP